VDMHKNIGAAVIGRDEAMATDHQLRRRGLPGE
jgi:hypothetical protein